VFQVLTFYKLGLIVFLYLSCRLHGEIVEINILHTTDVHAHMHEEKYSWVRLATKIRQQRQLYPQSLLIDCGDTIQGSLAGLVSRGEVAIDMLNHLKYDAWIPGNHELDFGTKRLAELLDKTQVPVLNGNFELTGNNPRKFKSWLLFERGGARIAVIGMQASYLPHWFIGRDFEQYKVSLAMDVLPAVMAEVEKAKPDMIIVALHQGYSFSDTRGVNEVGDIAKFYPQVDLILGGHTHQSHPGRNIFGVYYCQAAYHSSHLGVVRAFVDTDKHKVIRMNSWLDESASEADQEAMKVYLPWKSKVDAFAQQVVVQLPRTYNASGQPGVSCETSQLLGNALRYVAKTDLALHGKLSSESLPTNLSENALFKVVPYENNIYVLRVSLAQLKEILEEQLTTYKSQSFNAPSGFTIEINKTHQLLKINLPEEKALYTLAINSRVAAGGGGRFPRLRQMIKDKEIGVEELQINSRDALRTYLQIIEKPLSEPTIIQNW
jgi:2',3'-cyclic-nucleotide 2'-phosphodiesterase (5'-nucleotidase family)